MIDYPAHLAAMWQKAIAPREPDAPTVISTFAGGGGSLTGYLMAGYRDLLAVEWDDNAVATLRLNWPELDIYHGDIANLTVDEVLERTGLQPGELDVLDGSPPCQGFSTAGKRQFYDSRNQLFREYVRLLRGLQPKVFIMENVSGMVKGKIKLIFAEVMRELKASGYKVSCRLMNAMYFHVPQSRERVIFIGVRDDLGIEPSHPRAEGWPVTVGQAWKGISQELPQFIFLDLKTQMGQIAQKMIQGVNASAVTGKNGFNVSRLHFDRTSPTISTPGWGINSWTGQLHPTEHRKISIDELKRLASFPDRYLFDTELSFDSWKDTYKRIGNSVPPLFMEAIARHVRTEILDKVNRPQLVEQG